MEEAVYRATSKGLRWARTRRKGLPWAVIVPMDVLTPHTIKILGHQTAVKHLIFEVFKL